MAERSTTTVEIAGRQLALSNLDKVLYPACGFTKAQVIDYHARVAAVYLTHLAGRPVTLKRYPNGVDDKFFYEKNCPKHRPGWVPTARISSDRKTVDYCLLDEEAALIWTANLAALELHTTMARAESMGSPTMVVFDLDPGDGADVIDCARVAVQIRDVLARFDLTSFVKASGSKGLHLVVPLNTPTSYAATAGFASALAQLLTKHNPDKVTDNMRKDLRANRVFIDWSQNSFHKTTITAYSLRARQTPTVSAPLRWEEIEHLIDSGDTALVRLESDEVIDRIESHGDIWEPVNTLEQQLPELA